MNALSDNIKIQIYNTAKELYPSAYNFTKNEQAAEDLVMDVVERAINKYNLYQDGSNLKGWLFTMMRNLYINKYKTNLKEFKHSFELIKLTNTITYNEGELNLRIGKIRDTIKTLPLEIQETLRYLEEGYMYQEIAVLTNVPESTAKTRAFRARKLLTKKLKPFI